jgi:biotin carboxyl carrier protein
MSELATETELIEIAERGDAAASKPEPAPSERDGMERTQERVVLSPSTGLFTNGPASPIVTAEGEYVRAGDLVGTVEGLPVYAPIPGWLIAVPKTGQQVDEGEPIVAIWRT